MFSVLKKNRLYFIISIVSLIAFIFLCVRDSPINLAEAVSITKNVIKPYPTSYPYQKGAVIPATAYIEYNEVYNHESVIPPQCYTKTDGEHNPCYTCHQTYRIDKDRSNKMNDGVLQGQYAFSDLGVMNHWKNLFVDRRPLIKHISNEQISVYIAEDNYKNLITKQTADTSWQGEITPLKNLAHPDIAFDKHGVAKDNSHWIAFTYKPFPSTFWPTNGSTSDAMIRLPKAFREIKGQYNQDVYFTNLALLEITMTENETISLPAISEKNITIDINKDGRLSDHVTEINRQSHYVGDAKNIALQHTLYPEGTEFLHTVRYIGVDKEGGIYNAPRMKELRYMKKHRFKTPQNLASGYYIEQKEKNSENLPQVQQLGDSGINNNFGWILNGYIEDEQGELRHQNTQELAFCSGCHKTIGSTLDQTFSFPRKVSGAKGWGYQNLAIQHDAPNKGEKQGEFLTYFQRVGGGDEFRQNTEMLSRWFDVNGNVNKKKVASVKSIYDLIMPSPKRAMQLNKAYYTIVKEQSYIFGRDAMLSEATNVLKNIDEDIAPLAVENRYQWDIRLDWD
jgi:hypothetical protein